MYFEEILFCLSNLITRTITASFWRSSHRAVFAVFTPLRKVITYVLILASFRQEALDKRKEMINKLFEMLKVELHTASGSSDTDHLLHLLSICKARKLLNRAILIFDQVTLILF